MINTDAKHDLMKMLAVELDLTDGDMYEIYKVFDLFMTPEYLNGYLESAQYATRPKIVSDERYVMGYIMNNFEVENSHFFDSEKFASFLLTLGDVLIEWLEQHI